MLSLLVAVYRANPLRPHCRPDTGKHVLLCRLLRFGGTGNDAVPHRSRCPAKGN